MGIRKKVAAANWKMYKTASDGHQYLASLAADPVVSALPTDTLMMLFVPFTTLPGAAAAAGPNIRIGAQNFHEAAEGAYTGEVSLAMLRDLGIDCVLVGHSERRHIFAESAERIRAKLAAALAADDTVILCVGETLAEREAERTGEVLREQLRSALEGIDNSPDTDHLLIAYEPVWAIGTGRTATPEIADNAHALIRAQLNRIRTGLGDRTTILYGGSVKPDNCAELMARTEIDGVLVGGASLNHDSWIAITAAVAAA